MFNNMDKDQWSQLLMGLGARLLQSGGAGERSSTAWGKGIAGMLGDYGGIVQAARDRRKEDQAYELAKQQQQMNDQKMEAYQRQKELREKSRKRIEHIQSIPDVGLGITGISENIPTPPFMAQQDPSSGLAQIPGDAYLPGMATIGEVDNTAEKARMEFSAMKNSALENDDHAGYVSLLRMEKDFNTPDKPFELYSNVDTDYIGDKWGLNKITNKYERINMAGAFTPYRTLQTTDEKGLQTEAVVNMRQKVKKGMERFRDEQTRLAARLRIEGEIDKAEELIKLLESGEEIPEEYRISIKGKAPTDAGREMLLKVAKESIEYLRDGFFGDPDSLSDPRWWNIGSAQFDIPKTEGRMLKAMMEVGIQGIARMETGAAMNKDEIPNIRARFWPKVGDDLNAIRSKFLMYERMINGTLDLITPKGDVSNLGSGDTYNVDMEAFDAKFNLILAQEKRKLEDQLASQGVFRNSVNKPTNYNSWYKRYNLEPMK